jgi:hypothetical protein
MLPRSVTGFFCEDIRAEKSGTFSAMGIMPDNAGVPAAPEPGMRGLMGKLCLYIRVNLDIDDEVKTIHPRLTLADGTVFDMGATGETLIRSARSLSLKRNSPIYVVVLRGEFVSMPAPLGRMIAEVQIDEERYIAATLNLHVTGDIPADEAEDFEESRHFSQRV